VQVEAFRYSEEVIVDGPNALRSANEIVQAWRRWKLAKLKPFIDSVAELLVRNLEKRGGR
jgi:hypothetical protein